MFKWMLYLDISSNCPQYVSNAGAKGDEVEFLFGFVRGIDSSKKINWLTEAYMF